MTDLIEGRDKKACLQKEVANERSAEEEQIWQADDKQLTEEMMQRMISKIARIFPILILMGFLIVAIGFVVGYLNSQTAAAYFAGSKAVRETTLLDQRASIESTGLWLPYFKFLGIGLILGGIVMALRVIIDNLKKAGEQVLSNLPKDQRPALPTPPVFARFMPITMMIGEVILIAALIVGFGLASDARDLFSHPIPEIDAPSSASVLLTQLQNIKATSSWLVPFKFFGVATEFFAIVMGLSAIIFILTHQTELIQSGIQIARRVMKSEDKREEVREKVTA